MSRGEMTSRLTHHFKATHMCSRSEVWAHASLAEAGRWCKAALWFQQLIMNSLMCSVGERLSSCNQTAIKRTLQNIRRLFPTCAPPTPSSPEVKMANTSRLDVMSCIFHFTLGKETRIDKTEQRDVCHEADLYVAVLLCYSRNLRFISKTQVRHMVRLLCDK